jgi:hypothetical protein
MDFDRYDDGRLKVEGVSAPFPDVSQAFFKGDGFAAPAELDLRESGLFVATKGVVEADGQAYRIWRLTAAGRKAVGREEAA